MKIIKIGIILALALALTTGSLSAGQEKPAQKDKPTSSKGINWLKFDVGLAKLKADTTGKHMFIDFTASWCGWCKKMDAEAFADPTVVAMVRKHFIPVRVYGDSNNKLDVEGYQVTERQLAAGEFKVSGYPAFWFVSPQQMRIGPLRGYQTTSRLVDALTWVKDVQYDTTSAQGADPDDSQDNTNKGQTDKK